MARRRRQENGLERVLGTPALFATAYGNVGSSIYYALGVTAVFALGLTPLVFVIAGLIFAATAATYTEGTVRFPEAGGSSSFARHAFNEVVSFGAAWAQMLNYVITVAISVIFVPHYLSIFWGPLRTTPWDVIVGIIFTWLLVGLNVVGIQEAAKLNIVLAVLDFATQLVLVALGEFLIIATNAGVIGASRITYAMASYRQLPAIFRSLHRKFRTPWLSLVLFAGIAPSLFVLSGQVDFLGRMYAFGAMLSFTIAHVSVTALRVRTRGEEQLWRARPNWRVRGIDWPLFSIVGGLGTGIAWLVVVVQDAPTRSAGVGWLRRGV